MFTWLRNQNTKGAQGKASLKPLSPCSSPHRQLETVDLGGPCRNDLDIYSGNTKTFRFRDKMTR